MRISEFEKMLGKGGTSFIMRVFHEDEQEDTSVEHLAGMFAAKEAVIKALSLGPEAWMDIRIEKDKNGKPRAVLVSESENAVKSSDLSISHAGDYAVGFYVAVMA